MTMRWPGWFRFWSLGNIFTLSGLCYWSGTVCLFLFRWLNIYLYIYNYSYKMSQTDGKLPVWGSFRIPNQQKPLQTRPGDGLLSAVELLAFFSSLWSSFFLMIIWYFCAKSLVQAHVMTVMLPAACLAGWLSNQDWKPSIQLWLKKSTLRHTTGNIKIMMSWDLISRCLSWLFLSLAS